MAIALNSFETFEEEIYWVVSEIRKYLDTGVLANEIAIISRKHQTLGLFQELLSKNQISVNYDRSSDILENPVINQLLTMVYYINSISNLKQNNSEYLLPDILSYEFWGLTTENLWNLAISTSKNKNTWLEQINLENGSSIKNIIEFLLHVSQKAKTQTAEEILDLLIGNINLVLDSQSDANQLTTSPFKDFYFKQQSQDLDLLSGLKSLYEAIRNHTQKNIFYIADMVEYLNLMKTNNLKIYNKSTFFKNPNGLNLLTAHKSKGLEFEVVFVVNCLKSEWESRGQNSKIVFPNQIQIAPDKDNVDDFIRLFYVALTRSKNSLILTKSQKDNSGKDKEPLTFQDFEFDTITNTTAQKTEILKQFQTKKDFIIIDQKLQDLLLPVVVNYKLSVSGLLNFIDLTKGGPSYFLQSNLLQFPQAKSPSASYGTAAHGSIRDLYKEFKLTGNLPSQEYFLSRFETLLKQQNLNIKDLEQYLEVGKKELSLYYLHNQNNFRPDSILEMNFKSQEVHLENAVITGQIDKMDLDTQNREIVVTDFKTGKPSSSFEASEEFAKQKMWNYKQQLIFYKLLIENSAIYGQKYKVKTGKIEFIKPGPEGQIITLDLNIDEEESKKLEALTKIIYQKITSLDFPDTSNYSPNLKGSLSFIQDLLDGKI